MHYVDACLTHQLGYSATEYGEAIASERKVDEIRRIVLSRLYGEAITS